jgi:hypothetical protein
VTEIELPTPAWRLKEVNGNWLIYEYATFRTNEELHIFAYDDGSYGATLTGTSGGTVTDRLPQERWAALYQKAMAARALLGRKPTIIEEIF